MSLLVMACTRISNIFSGDIRENFLSVISEAYDAIDNIIVVITTNTNLFIIFINYYMVLKIRLLTAVFH